MRVSWDEATEIAAAAHVHTIKTYGPDRCAGFSPIPAMSIVSHCVGTRFIQLIGGVDDLVLRLVRRPAGRLARRCSATRPTCPSPATGGTRPYLMMWGSNVPVTRTPDAHWMTEVRYRGTKVVSVSPDYADNTKFADEWLPAQAGTDAALAMAMGHVILREYLVDRDGPVLPRLRPPVHRPAVPRHADRARRRVRRRQEPHRRRPRRRRARARRSRPCCWTRRPGRRWCPTARSASATPTRASGKWNLDLEGVTPGAVGARRGGRRHRGAAEVLLPCFEAPDGTGTVLRRGVPTRRMVTAPGHDGVRPDARAVRRRAATGCPGSGRPATTTPTRRTPRPGRRRSPRSPRRPRPGSRGSSRPTPRSPAAAR